MTLDEAIKILTARSRDFLPGRDPEERDAVKLGIEALLYVKKYKQMILQPWQTLLPGETKE